MIRRITLFACIAIGLSSCSNDDSTETLELKTSKQELSYVFGADHAGQLVNSGDPNFSKYDKLEIIKGFEIGIKDEKAFGPECQKTLEKLMGTTRQEFNAAYAKDGSNCIGKVLGSVFLSGWKKNGELNKFDLKFVTEGFKAALNGTDTLVPSAERNKIVQDFMAEVNKKMALKTQQDEKPYFASIKNKKGIESLPEGLLLETVRPGKGGKPAPGDDVQVDYILTNTKGDTIESSFAMKKMGQPMPAFNLNGVIRGWTVGVPFMQKGGAYRLYVPTALAYGKEPLVFYIELNNFGKPGTLAKAQM